MECSVEGCSNKALSKTWCKAHYERMRRYGRLEAINKPKGYTKVSCIVDGCETQSETREGYCVKHYKLWKRNGTPERVLRQYTSHKCEHCGKVDNLRRGLCKACALRRDRKGYVERDKAVNGSGTVTKAGYRLMSSKFGEREYEHRIIAGAKPGQHVHHIDGNRLNNDPSNLKVFDSHAEHMAEHRKAKGHD